MRNIKEIENDIISIELDINNYFNNHIELLNMQYYFFKLKTNQINVFLDKKYICQIYYNQKEKEVKIVVGYAVNISTIKDINNILNVFNNYFFREFYKFYDTLKVLKKELNINKKFIENQLIDLEFSKIEVNDIFINNYNKITILCKTEKEVKYSVNDGKIYLTYKRNKKQFLNILKYHHFKLSTYSSRKKKLKKL